jgi:uncharacterized membrane protein YcaP (DUF421 family)
MTDKKILPIVIEGIILDQNLKTICKDRQWLIDQLKKQGYEREHIPFIESAHLFPGNQLQITFPI